MISVNDSIATNIETLASTSYWKTGALLEDNNQAWYIPENLEVKDSVVCILFCDPQGDGKKPLELYKQLAKKNGFMLVGSKLSKNGMGLDESKTIVSQLIGRILAGSGFKRIAFYAAGFSGGAKVALHASAGLPTVKGVIYSGAVAVSDIPIKPLFGFAGNMDMNMADLVQFDADLPASFPHFLKIWNGKHEWPSPEIFASALEWIKIRENAGSGQLEKRRIDLQFEARRTKNLLEKESLLLESKFLAEDAVRKDLENEDLNILQTRPAFIESKKLLEQEINDELAMKEFYNPAFFEKEIPWWRSEIAELKAHKKHKSANLQDRMLGYFSLAAYSLANRALQEQNDKQAEKILEIYRLSDPKNAEQAYLRAVLAGRRQQTNLVLEALAEAVKLGFNDKKRVLQQEEFRNLAENTEFKKILDL